MRKDVGRENILYVHVTLLPRSPRPASSRPSRPSTGQGAARHRHPARCHRPARRPPGQRRDPREDRAVHRRRIDAVIPAATADDDLRGAAPVRGLGLGRLVVRELGLGDPTRARPRRLARARRADQAPKPVLEIALVGKYIELPDAYLSVTEALKHAAGRTSATSKIRWVDSEALTQRQPPRAARGRRWDRRAGRLRHRGIEGKVLAAHFARDHKVPYLGLCLGLQCGVIEFARDVVGTKDANSTEFDMFTDQPGHRLHAGPARHRGQGRHDAPGPLPGPADAGLEGRARTYARRSSTSATATASR